MSSDIRSGMSADEEPWKAALDRLVSDDATCRPLDTLAELAREAAGADLATVTIVRHDEDRQCFRGRAGFPGALQDLHQTPLSRSFCKHVVAASANLVVSDAANDPRVADNPAIEELGVAAYLGVPIHTPDGTAIGALCAIRHEPHAWEPATIRSMERLALCVSELIVSVFAEYKAAFEAERAETLRAELASLVANVNDEIEAPLRAIASLATMVRSSQTGSDAVALRVIEESAATAAQILRRATHPALRERGDAVWAAPVPSAGLGEGEGVVIVAPELQRRLAVRTALARTGTKAVVLPTVAQAFEQGLLPPAIVIDATVPSFETDQATDELRRLQHVDSAVPVWAVAFDHAPFEGFCDRILTPAEDPVAVVLDAVATLSAPDDAAAPEPEADAEPAEPAATVAAFLPRLAG